MRSLRPHFLWKLEPFNNHSMNTSKSRNSSFSPIQKNKRKQISYKAIALYALLTFICLLPVTCFTILVQLTSQTIQQRTLQIELAQNAHAIHQRASIKYKQSSQLLLDYENTLKDQQVTKEQLHNLTILKQARDKAQQHLRNTATLLPEIPSPNSLSIPMLESVHKKYNTFAAYSCLLTLIPLFFSIPSYRKALPILPYNKRQIIFGIQAIPAIQQIIYIIYSLHWNLDGAQRKNNALFTIPLSTACMACYYFALTNYNDKPYNTFCLVILSTILAGITHIRFLQMLEYRKINNTQSKY